MRGPFVKVRQTEEACCEEQRLIASDTALQQVLQPTAKEEFFRNGNKKEREEKGPWKPRQPWRRCVQMQKPEAQAKRKRDRRIEDQFAQTRAEIVKTQAEIESNTIQLPYCLESPDACIEKKNFVEDRKVGRPGALQPAEVDSQAEKRKQKKVAPVAMHIWITAFGLPQY